MDDTDSVNHHKDRRARIRQMAAEEQEVTNKNAADVQQRERESMMSREQLLDEIRRMRNEAVVKTESDPRPPLSEWARKQLEAEQECGRQAVAKAQAEQELARQMRERYAAQEAAGEKNRT